MLRRTAQDNTNNAVNTALNLNNESVPPLIIADNQQPQGQQAAGNRWNLYKLDPMIVDVTGEFVLSPLP